MVAVAKEDPRLCNKLNNDSLEDQCVLSIAKRSQNPVHCSKIKDNYVRDLCYLDYVSSPHRSHDIEYTAICNAISNKNLKWFCYAEICTNLRNIGWQGQIYKQADRFGV